MRLESTLRTALFIFLFFFTTLYEANAQTSQTPSSSSKTGKEACTFLETPVLDESKFGTLSLEHQFNVVRDLRSRMADILPKQKTKMEATRAAADKLLAEKKTLDERGATADTGELRKTADEFEAKITANRGKLGTAKPEEKDDLEREFQVLQGNKIALTRYIEETKKLAERANKIPQELNDAEGAFERENSCLLYLQDLNNRIEQKTIELLIPASQKSSFKLYLSIIYAVIVLVLIGGFYGLAFVDRGMRTTIFAQQSGIQFITLFSLVIAIILFGVLEILADKELAALLAGISGYILGHVTTDRPVAAPISGSAPRAVSGTTIAFAASDQITDSASLLATFAAGDRIRISGTAHNDGVYTAASVSDGSIRTHEKTIQDEAAGNSVRISTLS
jgi:hypothetical protein